MGIGASVVLPLFLSRSVKFNCAASQFVWILCITFSVADEFEFHVDLSYPLYISRNHFRKYDVCTIILMSYEVKLFPKCMPYHTYDPVIENCHRDFVLTHSYLIFIWPKFCIALSTQFDPLLLLLNHFALLQVLILHHRDRCKLNYQQSAAVYLHIECDAEGEGKR